MAKWITVGTRAINLDLIAEVTLSAAGEPRFAVIGPNEDGVTTLVPLYVGDVERKKIWAALLAQGIEEPLRPSPSGEPTETFGGEDGN